MEGDRRRLRAPRFALSLAVLALVLGTPHVDGSARGGAAFGYAVLALCALLPLPWRVACTLDIAASATVVAVMGGRESPFLLLLALPVLVWGLLRELPGGRTAALAAVLANFILMLQHGSDAPGRVIGPLLFQSLAFALLGLCAGLLGQRIEAERSAHQRTRQELEETRLDADSILAAVPVGLLCIDAHGRLRRWNRAAEELLGTDTVLRAGATVPELEASPGLEPLARWLRERSHPGAAARGELMLSTRKGGLPIEIASAPLRGASGEERGLVLRLADLRERVAREQTEKRQEKLALIGQLSAGLAHEIRNSLKPITGSVELLAGELPRNARSAHVLMEIIQREADSLERFLSDFLAYARDKRLQVETLPLESVIEEEALAWERSHAVPLRCFPPREGPLWARVDAPAIRQVLRNLTLNAEEAGGALPLEVSSGRDGEEVWVRIRDHGPGIPEELRSEVFEPFFTTKARGTGLGLAIARDLTERHGGRLSLEPAAGGGTAAILRLPCAARQAA